MSSTTTRAVLVAAWCCLAAFACLEGSGYVPPQDAGFDVDLDALGDITTPDAGQCQPYEGSRNPLTNCPEPAVTTPLTGPRAYVTIANQDHVAVIDLCDPLRPVLARCVDVDPNPEWSDEPYDLAVAADGSWFVTVPHGFGFTNGQLWRFAPAALDDPISANLTVEPDHVAISPDGETVYVASLANADRPLGPYTENGALRILDASTLDERRSFSLGLAAADVKVSADGTRVVVAVAGEDELFVYTPADEGARFIAVGDDPRRGDPNYQPFYLELSEDGTTAFVTAFKSGELRAVDLDTEEVRVVDLGDGAQPRDIARHRGKLLVTDTANSTLLVVDEETLELESQIVVGPPVVTEGAPFGVAGIPNTPLALVANSRDPIVASEPGAVLVVEITSGQVVASVKVGLGPRLLEVVP